jgi:hypothetical protein
VVNNCGHIVAVGKTLLFIFHLSSIYVSVNFIKNYDRTRMDTGE